uniref:Forkhead associated phosphopeptide binding domain 1 n=1 Tax=Lepisosteus oculatus TaxID=7918 RepID=W5M386_LEPOC
FSKMRETKKHEEELLARENEVIVLKKSVEEMERRMAEMRAEQGRSVSERETMNITLAEKCQDVRDVIKTGSNESKSMLCTIVYIDERITWIVLRRHQHYPHRRHSVEETQWFLSVMSCPDCAVALQVTEQMTVIIEERDELKSRVQDLQGQLDGWTSEQDKTAADTEQLKRALQECQARVQEAPSVPSLQREIAALRDQGAPPSLSWVRALALSMLSSLLSWQQEAARALQDAGIDVAASANVFKGAVLKYFHSVCLYKIKQNVTQVSQRKKKNAAPRRDGQYRQSNTSPQCSWQPRAYSKARHSASQVKHSFKALWGSCCAVLLIPLAEQSMIRHSAIQHVYHSSKSSLDHHNSFPLLQQLEEREQERDRLQQALSEQRSELGRVEDQCRHLTQSVPQKSVLRKSIRHLRTTLKYMLLLFIDYGTNINFLLEEMEAKRQEVESLTGRQQELSRELQSAREREVSNGPVCSTQIFLLLKKQSSANYLADLQQEAQRQQACWPAKERAAEERGARLEQERQGVREAEYREQVHQHARTIVALEQRLARAAQSQRAGEEERAALEARLRGEEGGRGRREAEKRLESRSPSIPPAPPVPRLNLFTYLKAELAEAQREAAAQRDTIAGLSRDLAGAHAKMSDMAGELSEQQKLELEQHRALVAEQRSELSVLRQRLAQMSQLVEQKGQDLLQAEEELRRTKEPAALTLSTQPQETHSAKLFTCDTCKLGISGWSLHSPLSFFLKDQSAAAELADLGAKCKGHRHEEVIQRQREALAELRARIKALEQTRPQRSSPERAVQQVALMRRELSELRAQQAVADSLGPLRAARELSQTSSAELPLTDQAFEETLDRTARLDLSDALDLSERTYRDLVKALSGALELGELSGCASLKHLPPDERDRLGSRRQQDLELLLTRLRVLHGQAQRKEELLSEYQADLRRLRESQAVGQQLQAELDRLRQELQSQTQENSLLREALERAQQRLEQEKNLNRVIKERKV